jgi:hypothetical protein
MKLSLKRKKKDEVADDVKAEAVEEKSAPVAVKPVSSGGKEWLLLHAEKLVCAGVAVLFGLMVYSVIGKFVLNSLHTPDNLKEKVDAVNASVDNSKFPQERYPVPSFADDARRGLTSIPFDGFAFKAVTGEDIGDDGGKRDDPKLYPPIDLEVKAGSGVFYVKQQNQDLKGIHLPVVQKNNKPLPQGIDRGVEPPAGALREGRRWVTIIGQIPIAQQHKEYDAVFRNAMAYDAERDQPKYRIAIIQRLEIEPGTPAAQLDWSKAKTWGRAELQDKFLERSKWAIEADEVVDKNFLIAELVDPLGPLGKSWKPWATHSQIPFAPPKQDAPRPNRIGSRLAPAGPAAKDDAKDDAPDDNAVAPVDDIFGKPNEEKEPEQPVVDEQQPAPEPEEPKETMVPYKLVRVFDFTVEPGKQYRYKIQLYIYNPNYGVEPRFLVNPDSRDNQFRSTDWSEPSETVRIPEDAQVLAAGVLPKTEEVPEERVNIIANLLDIAAGMAPSVRLQLRRGAVVGGRATGLEIDSANNVLVEHVDLPVKTDVTLLDFGGGGNLAAGVDAPTKMLVLDGNGNLTVRNSADDAAGIVEFATLEGAQPPAQELGPRPATGPKKPDEKDGGDVGKLLGS